MSSDQESFIIRDLVEDDCPQLLTMIFELTDYINELDLIVNTEEGLRQDLFGEPKRCHVLVAERIGHGSGRASSDVLCSPSAGLVGYSLYFQAYCTLKRSYLYMEDLFVREAYRGRGLGKRLYQAVAQKALDLDFHKVGFTVLSSNTNAREFYHRMGTTDQTVVDGRHRMQLDRKQMEKLVTS